MRVPNSGWVSAGWSTFIHNRLDITESNNGEKMFVVTGLIFVRNNSSVKAQNAIHPLFPLIGNNAHYILQQNMKKKVSIF